MSVEHVMEVQFLFLREGGRERDEALVSLDSARPHLQPAPMNLPWSRFRREPRPSFLSWRGWPVHACPSSWPCWRFRCSRY